MDSKTLAPEAQADEYREVGWGLTSSVQKIEPVWINRPNVAKG
jgi:hypothetical protein